MKNLEDYTPDCTSRDVPSVDDSASLPGLPNLLCNIWALRTTHWAEFLSTLITTVACIPGLLGGDSSSFSLIAILGSMIGFALGMHTGGFGNPILTVAMAYAGRLPYQKARTYLAMQFAGALVGATATYLYYSPAVDAFEGGKGIRTISGSAKFFTTIYAPDALHFGYSVGPLASHMVLQNLFVLGHSAFIPVDVFHISAFTPLHMLYLPLSTLPVTSRHASYCTQRDTAAKFGLKEGKRVAAKLLRRARLTFFNPYPSSERALLAHYTTITAIFGARVGITLDRDRRRIEKEEDLENQAKTGALRI
ncbi:hypothetical protein BOTBODRAFT_181118 [Botryobasidium botryosum FD-172 SS1]|uniref:Aquaporin n=1 Tax=Botryobasidium botryosum (strain FD-172 SS1) TaxID=930990 RepID=A0A067LUI6_BOTB1|nr:hypothetical protein BOTBODRAFT_181118 [Botryobasidium botryosum FD-172 SS1]